MIAISIGEVGMTRKAAKSLDSHERIRTAAARALRRDGAEGLSVHKVMREAGLTVGGFYAHYPSREELVTDAFSAATHERRAVVARVLEGVPPGKRPSAFVSAYLAPEHLDDLSGGCPWAAVLSDLPRAPESMRNRITEQFARSAAGLHPDRRVSIATLMVSFASLIMMRAVTDEALRQEISEAAQCAVEGVLEKIERVATEGGKK